MARFLAEKAREKWSTRLFRDWLSMPSRTGPVPVSKLAQPLRPGLRYAAAAAAVEWRTRRYLLQASPECLASSRRAMEYPEPSRDGNSVGEHALGSAAAFL